MRRYYFVINDYGKLEETENKIDLTGLSGNECELALFSNSDIIIQAESKTEAINVIDTEYLESKFQ